MSDKASPSCIRRSHARVTRKEISIAVDDVNRNSVFEDVAVTLHSVRPGNRGKREGQKSQLEGGVAAGTSKHDPRTRMRQRMHSTYCCCR